MVYIYKGDDTTFGAVQKIAIDLRGVTMPSGYIIEAHLCGDVVASVTLPARTIAVVLSAEQTGKLACGLHYLRLVAFDTDGKRETFASIPLNVTTDASKTSGDYIVPAITAGLNPASKTALGVVRVGSGIEVAQDGTISVKGGGGGGTSDYNDLDNKPKINGIELGGDKTAADLGLADVVRLSDVETVANEAHTAAIFANTVASDAKQNAEEAIRTAVNAESTVQTALEAAAGAVDVANTAIAKVNEASANAEEAVLTAQDADMKVEALIGRVDEAESVADDAKNIAESSMTSVSLMSDDIRQIRSDLADANDRINELEEAVGNANTILEGVL